MPVDGADSAPDVCLELISCGVDHIPEVDLVGQLGERGQERLDGGVGASRSKVLKFVTELSFFHSRKNGGLTGIGRETTPEKMSG